MTQAYGVASAPLPGHGIDAGKVEQADGEVPEEVAMICGPLPA